MQFRNLISSTFCLVLFFAAMCGSAQTSPPSEYELKAAFIYNFAKFIDWPPTAFADEKAPFVIGVLGENPFGQNLERTVAGKDINSRPVVLRALRNVKESTQCHLLFVSNSMSSQLPEIFKKLKGASVLTIGESEEFIRLGGMVRFVDDAKKVRFQIDSEAAKAAHMKISSRLLTLALPLNP